MAKVLVTGGAGFIGSHTIRTLRDMGQEATNLDSFSHSTLPLPPTFLENMAYRTEHLLNGAQAIRGRIQYRDGLRRHLLGAQPEYIIHLAARPSAATALQATVTFAQIAGRWTSARRVGLLATIRSIRWKPGLRSTWPLS